MTSYNALGVKTLSPPETNSVVVLSGPINAENSEDISQILSSIARSGRVKRLVLDMGEVSYIDSHGVATLHRIMKLMMQQNGRMVLKDCNSGVAKVLDIVKSGAHKGVFANREEMDAYLYSLQTKYLPEALQQTA